MLITDNNAVNVILECGGVIVRVRRRFDVLRRGKARRTAQGDL